MPKRRFTRQIKFLAVASLLAISLLALVRTQTNAVVKSPTAAQVILANAVSQLRTPLSHEDDLDSGDFQSISITGYVNNGDTGDRDCGALRYEGDIQGRKSWYLEDDLMDTVRSLENHPMVDYDFAGLSKDATLQHKVAKSWTQLAGSSVWIESLQVFFTVTRVVFYRRGRKHKSIISFLRGHLHDANWRELKNFTVQWQGKEITFPVLFDIPFVYRPGEGFFGPEDPRVAIEEGVDGAEPVVIFNMVIDLEDRFRAVHIFRPFSGGTAVLSIAGQKDRRRVEKNWPPFFDHHDDVANWRTKPPHQYVHFVYNLSPLRVLKCHMSSGSCDVVYEQTLTDNAEGLRPGGYRWPMSGGTNLVPLQLKANPRAHAWVGFSRSHIMAGCVNDLAIYRPELMILVAHNLAFYLQFMSDPIEFGDAALTSEALVDPCGEGRILIVNSIAQWKRELEQDVMTLSFSVADATVQFLQLAGVSRFIEEMLPRDGTFPLDGSDVNDASWSTRHSGAGNHVLNCAIEAAASHSETIVAADGGKPKIRPGGN